MRALFHNYDEAHVSEVVSIAGASAHHLNVVRIKSNEVILLMNGKGCILTVEVLSIAKNQVDVQVKKKEMFSPKHELSLAIANPKKDAFEDILKLAVELGINHIYPLRSEFSQYDYEPTERMERLLESALIQSNNPFFPTVHPQGSLSEFLSSHPNEIYFFNSKPQSKIAGNRDIKAPKTILIGPEGGFSPSEVGAILAFSKLQEVHLPTPILRAPSAVAAAVGYLLA